MKVLFRATDKITLEAEGETHFELFEQLAKMQEIFAQEKCGVCENKFLQFAVRKAVDGKKEFLYPELRCTRSSCRAKLKFGQMMEGGELFPIRNKREGKDYVKDENGKLIPVGKNGWVKYNPETKQEE